MEDNLPVPKERSVLKERSVRDTVKSDEGFVYLVNPGGAVHCVSLERARYRMRSAGWRRATEAERVKAIGHNQTHKKPIAPRWNPGTDLT